MAELIHVGLVAYARRTESFISHCEFERASATKNKCAEAKQVGVIYGSERITTAASHCLVIALCLNLFLFSLPGKC